MANSTFQSITGPSGPEGIKAIGVTGNSGDTGGIGVTGPEAPFVSRYKWSEVDPSNGEERIKLTLSDESVVYVGGVSGQNAYVAGVTALGDSVGNPSGQIFKQTTTAGPDPSGATFQFRGLTAAVDLGIEWAENTISISSPIGITTGYVDAGSTGEFLFLSPRYKAQGGSGSFYDSSGVSNPTGTGDTVNVKFRNAIANLGDEYNIDFCNSSVVSDGGDGLKEYILDVQNLVRFSPPEENGKRFGYLCMSVRFLGIPDRLVVLRTKVDNDQDTEIIRKPLYGASEVNFENPLEGNLLLVSGENNNGEGYGNDGYRRDITSFNTPYENLNEGYVAGVHPQVWSGSTGAPAVDYPSEQAVIFDTNCINDSDLEGKFFRGKPFCSDLQSDLGSGTHSYCIRIEEDHFESQNESSPWYGKIRLVVMPGCGSNQGNSTAWNWKISCNSVCSCQDAGIAEDNPYGGCCTSTVSDCDSLVSGPISGRLELDITNTDVFNVSAPIDISGITWSYEQRAGISLGSNDGNEFGEMKNVTLIIDGGPNNIRFPENVKFAGTPTFTNGVDIINLVTIDNGGTWFATQTGYGWDVDIFKEDQLGSCCSNLGCVNFVNKTYCDQLNGSFEEGVPCFRRTDPECGAGITGGCCSGLDGTVNTGVLCDDAGDHTPPPGHSCCGDDGNECIPGGEDFPEYLNCFLGNCDSCCGGELKYAHCDFDICILPVQQCCFADKGYCVEIADGCNSCEALGATTVTSCEVCNIGNDLPFKCCAPCPFGCIDVRDAAACSELQGTPSPNGLCSGCLGQPQYGDSDIVGSPKCLTPSNLLQCNLINGYFVPSSVTEDVCSICETINICDPDPVGACCDDVNGDCRGIMLEVICLAIAETNPGISWLGPDTECDDCCGNQEFRGACCFCNENCVGNLTPQECSSLRGIFMGIDSTCGSVNCSIAGPCDCPCEETGCCDCPTGHPFRSPCCDQPESPECCGPNDDCGDDDDDDDDNDDNDNGIDDTEGYKIPLFPGGDGEGGPGTPRSDWLKGACCLGGPGKCFHVFIPSRLLGQQIDPSNPDSYFNINNRCNESLGGQFTPWQTCADVNCAKSDFIGACCCATWTIDCVDDDQLDNGDEPGGCVGCTIDDIVITCSDCGFNGGKPGFSQPIVSAGGPYKEMPPGYPPVFIPPGPTDPKGKQRPGTPFVTPDGNKIPYDAGACCKNPGGCKSAPCTLENRIIFADELGLSTQNPCLSYNDLDPECPSANQNDVCSGSCGSKRRRLGDVCGFCNGLQLCNGECNCNIPSGVDRTIINPETGSPEFLEDAANSSSCNECECLPGAPVCPSCADVKCEDTIQSTCRFLFDKSAKRSPSTIGTACDTKVRVPDAKNPSRNGGGNSSPGFNNHLPHPNKPPYESDSSSICEKNGKVFGKYFGDGKGVGLDYESPFWNSNVNRQAVNESNQQNNIDFRQINSTVEVVTSTLNGRTTMSYKRR